MSQAETQITTHFVTAEVELQDTADAMQQAIEAELRQWGEPLRWAIVAVDAVGQTAQVEAVVIQGTVPAA